MRNVNNLDKLDRATTLKMLARLNVHYPQAQRSPSELQILAEDWAPELAEFGTTIVFDAIKRHLRTCAYFPTIADVIRHCREIEEEMRREQGKLALPMGYIGQGVVTPERAKWWLDKILKRNRGEVHHGNYE